MSVLLTAGTSLSPWIRDEVELSEPLTQGADGQPVKRVQEWLNLHGYGLAIDGDFGRVTEQKIKQFQQMHGLEENGIVDDGTFRALVHPLLQALTPLEYLSESLSDVVHQYALAHLAQRPREVGGQNCGPWVRLYMEGHQGEQWAWCAGFVKFILHQAAETLQVTPPILGSFSCDTLAAQGQMSGRLVRDIDLLNAPSTIEDLSASSIFLVRRTDTDWTHAGLVTAFNEVTFETIEGNTNDEGSREGFEVCARSRGYANKDFITLS